METKTTLSNMLPGWVCKQYVRRGKKLCGPYWYRLWREGGRLRKRYVRPESAEAVKALCAEWQAAMRGVRARRKVVRFALSAIREMAREVRSLRQYA